MSDVAADADITLLSPASASSQQSQWPRPRTPIDPLRLAKLANALGIATPIPMRTSSDSAVQPSPRSAQVDTWGSPTPSAAATSNLSAHSTLPSFQSKFLLHVIPPPHLPHDTHAADVLLTPPPASASGYHTQFRRGTLVPLLPSFQAQLGAIAKEYALPSTTGMILYLVTSSSTPSPSLAPSPSPSVTSRQSSLDTADEPGPRLSEEIWKHLWTRVVKTELGGFPSRAGTPVSLGLNASASPGMAPTLRPLVSKSDRPPLAPTSSSTVSSSTNGASEASQSEATTPDTSLPSESNVDALDLPGLHSPSLIPILAKVEFDIDKRKAAWYGPWLRSRKRNHQKRVPRHASDDDIPSSSHLDLKLVNRQAKPRFLASYDGEEDPTDELEYAPRTASPEEEDDLTARYDEALSPSKRVPPRLVLPPNESDAVAVGSNSPRLAYRESDTEDEGNDVSRPSKPRRSPLEEKREGAFFDDLVLGLRFEGVAEFDEDDPYDRRRSQFIMKQRLDEIERNLQQFSPRKLKYEDEPSVTSTPPRPSKALHALSPSGRFLSPTGSPPAQSELDSEPPRWPAVPYSQLSGDDSVGDVSADVDNFPSPPKFALNGVSNAIPMSPYKQSFSEGNESEESKARRREFDEGQDPSYPAIVPPSLRQAKKTDSFGSPVIPLSPDPFGRFPSEPVPPVPALPSRMSESSHRSSSSQSRTVFSFDTIPDGADLERENSMSSVSDARASKLSSRFSMDSDDHSAIQRQSRAGQPQAGGASLNPVKSIRTLWRKSRKTSVSGAPPPPPGPMPRVPSINGGQIQAQAQAQSQQQQSLGVPMPRLSEEVVTNAMLPPGHPRRGSAHPDAPPSVGSAGGPLTTAEMMRRARGEQSINSIHFDQESPYPIRRSTGQPRQQPPSPQLQSAPVPLPSTTPPPDSVDTKGGARKSILKSWRGNGVEADAPAQRKRRPSVLDMVRSSRTGGDSPVPPSPMLPEQYAQANAHARMSESSQPSSRNSGPQLVTPTGPVADEAFEIVDGGMGGGHAKAPSLSYPYHELDHQA
ncbi:hypothetical protein K488DRAFT_89599 [Vararia minispora EC-137]|uniref:Uncharacterized protein n=1 Tax=Vararia minispora EC-137 TaxID=1314806 RepID=A0ACB8Q9V7_9AGAM|nr:hypothetical protein K488DRAFT_89599 [Vararia minispora EC-137]